VAENGDTVVATSVEGVEHQLAAVVYSWLDGPNLGERMTLRQARAMGHTIATLHEHGGNWEPPADTAFFRLDSIMMDMAYRLDHIAWIDEASATVLENARTTMEAILAPVYASPRHVIHADVHMWNTKWHNNQISIFDFDDCGIGVPLQDLGISAYYMRDMPRHEAALLAGYAERRPLPDHTPEQFEALVASRNLILLNDVVGTVTAGYDQFAPDYLKRTVSRLAHWLDAGLFKLDPPA
jgi:Ser/Thr protein kinase RdoA (MazF antagonist)